MCKNSNCCQNSEELQDRPESCVMTLAIMNLNTRKDFFMAILILGITLASNLATGFISDIIMAHILKWEKRTV